MPHVKAFYNMDFISIAEEGCIMPLISTWFELKLSSGILYEILLKRGVFNGR